MRERVIELRKYSDPGVGVLAGRERGEAVRKEERLDALDRDESAVVDVVIPDEVFSVNSSFTLGMFTESIRKLGPDRFRAKYRFRGPNAERTREEGIKKALLTSSPLRTLERQSA